MKGNWLDENRVSAELAMRRKGNVVKPKSSVKKLSEQEKLVRQAAREMRQREERDQHEEKFKREEEEGRLKRTFVGDLHPTTQRRYRKKYAMSKTEGAVDAKGKKPRRSFSLTERVK